MVEGGGGQVLLLLRVNPPPPASLLLGQANWTALTAPFPPQLHLLTLHSWGPNTLLVRLAHTYEAADDAVLSRNATVSLQGMLAGVTLASVTEMTLPASQPLSAAPTTTYNLVDGSSVTLPIIPPAPVAPAYAVTLSAMQIRTFMCTLA
jgi:hypothetical protein